MLHRPNRVHRRSFAFANDEAGICKVSSLSGFKNRLLQEQKNSGFVGIKFDDELNPILGNAELRKEKLERVAYRTTDSGLLQKDQLGVVKFLSPMEGGSAIAPVLKPGMSAEMAKAA